MPYVEGFGTYPFGEEWLFDAYVRSHLPVLRVARDLTMTVTPVLADQLEAPGVPERLGRFTRDFRVGSARLDERDVEPALKPACLAEGDRYARELAELESRGDDLLGAFRDAAARGVELVPSSATHAILPLIATREARMLQLDAGLRSHRRRFGEARGFWLPECAYEPGLEHLLADFGVEWFWTDQSAHEPAEAALRPIATGAGVVALPIDWEAIGWLWSLQGYPSDPVYADFHRKSLRGTRPWSIGGDPYDPERAAERAREQAREFAAAVADRLAAHREGTGSPGLLTFAIDTELLGHWWWEGPIWLEEALAELPRRGVRAVTSAQAVAEHGAEERQLRTSSWGDAKDLRTWDSPRVADMTWALRRLELTVLRAIGAGRLRGAALERAARELVAAQASDWAFLDYRRQAGDYPFERALGHSQAVFEAIERPDEQRAKLRNLAPDLTPAALLEP
jgi:1,4-alpha-glucan branching enzyme